MGCGGLQVWLKYAFAQQNPSWTLGIWTLGIWTVRIWTVRTLDVPEGHHHEEVPEKPANSSKVLTLVIIIVVALLLIWGGRGIPQGLKPLLLVAGFLAVIWLFTPQASAEESRDLPSVQRLKHTENPKINLNDLNPRELEFYLANTINQLIGWQAEVTKAANDQGADVIVTGPQGQRIAIQVKHYKRKVGNKAVQEIVASKALYDCPHARCVYPLARGIPQPPNNSQRPIKCHYGNPPL